CLLLTLLAVPVFYSLFDDLTDSKAWHWFAARWRWLRMQFGRRVWRPIKNSIGGIFGGQTKTSQDAPHN
ncbi:MAG: hypothetical protein H7Z37_12660, partial [Pyrinomonadaceae bacterium]|nr:hypothetical protein [Pyrinomonadaceae bacterium]